MSSAYRNTFLGSSFSWYEQDTVWRRFVSDEEAIEHREGRYREAQAIFFEVAPRWEALLAREKDVAVLPFDPFHVPLRLKHGDDLAPVHPDAYPLTARLDISRSHRAFEHLDLTLAGPPPPGALERARIALRAAAEGVEGGRDGEFRNPVAEVRWGERCGFYVGLPMEVSPELEKALRPKLRRVLEAFWPIVEEKTAGWPAVEPTHDDILGFDPCWAPLLNEGYARGSSNLGQVELWIAHKVMERGRYLDDWLRGHPLNLPNVISGWEAAGVGLPDLDGRSQRFIPDVPAPVDAKVVACLVRQLRSRPRVAQRAGEILSKRRRPEGREAFLSLLREERFSETPVWLVARGLEPFPDAETVERLLALYPRMEPRFQPEVSQSLRTMADRAIPELRARIQEALSGPRRR